MLGHRSPRVVLLALTVGLAAAAFGAGASPSVAAAASPHRAAVIVDTGGTVHRVVITFTEDSISGIEALQRAGGNPVVYVFGGQGGAVCRIYGVGRDAGPGCLGGADGDNRYWAYFRAPAGTSTFTYSSIGAGSARVHDGDVEGWKFGTGTAPAYVSLATLSPPPPPPASPPATAAATQPPNGSPAGDGGNAPTAAAAAGSVPAGSPTTASTRPVTAPAGSAKDSGTSTKRSSAAVDHETDANGKPISTKLASADDGGGGGSSWSLLLFAVLLVAIVAAILIVRRVRARGA